jgi:hypothetical protein
MARLAFAEGRLMMLALSVGSRPVAMKFNLLAGDGSFAFKIAFSESCAKFSPGVLLEMYNIQCLHERADIRWMDSCADPDHPMISPLWKDRRTIETMWVAGPGACSQLALAVLPAARWLRDRLRRRPKHAAPADADKQSEI